MRLRTRRWPRRLVVALAACAPASAIAAEPSRPSTVTAKLQTPEDRRSSPFTGYTRAHWLEITEKLLAGVLPYLDPDTGMPKLRGVAGETGHFDPPRYDPLWAQQESLERIMMAAVVYTAATGRDRVPGYDGSITEPFLRAIRRGTDPADPAHWPPKQRFHAFGSVIGMGVLISPRFFWDPLGADERRHLLAFFGELSTTESYDNNHHYFHMLPVPMLEQHGAEAPRERQTAAFERLLGWYRGDGWFIDGDNRGFDWYNAWGFQIGNHLLYRYDPPWRERFGERIRGASRAFLQTLPFFYGRDGGPIPLGRSLAYRFASVAAIGWAVLNDASPLPPGEARRVASGCLKYFWDHGALSEDGLLEPGFHGPNSVVAESYVTHGTTYWAAQGLVPLLLPAEHPFWTEVEQPMPADGAGARLALPGAQMVVRVRPDGEARLFPVGQPFSHPLQPWQRGIKYDQHAYSSDLGWCALGDGGPDLGAGRTGTSRDGRSWLYRLHARPVTVSAERVMSTYPIYLRPQDQLAVRADDLDQVTTHTLIGRSGELHVFWHDSATPLYLHIGGYGISIAGAGEPAQARTANELRLVAGEYRSLLRIVQAPEGSLAVVVLPPRPGWTASHLFGGRGAFAYWRSAAPVPPHLPVVAYVDGARGELAALPAIEVRDRGGVLEVTFEGRRTGIEIPARGLNR